MRDGDKNSNFEPDNDSLFESMVEDVVEEMKPPAVAEKVTVKKGSGFQRDKQVPLGYLPGVVLLLLGVGFAVSFIQGVSLNQAVFGILADDKKDYFIAISAAMASILGFEMAAATIFLTVQHEQSLELISFHGLLKPLFETFIKAMVFSGCSLLTAFAGMLWDKEPGLSSAIIEWLNMVSLSLCFAYLAQTIVVLATVGSIVLHKAQKNVRAKHAKK